MEPLAPEPEPAALPKREELAREREALRIQAAAVAAQQAALTEEEVCLEHRRQALDHQEAQLAAHLEAKRQRALHIRKRLQARARMLKRAEQDQELQSQAAAASLEKLRGEVKQAEEAARAERQRLLELRQRFVRHWRRRWVGQETELERRANRLARERHSLDQRTATLRREKADLVQAQMRANGEVELARRQLQAEREELGKQAEEQNRLENESRARARVLDEREQALCIQRQRLIAEQVQRQQTLSHLQAEIDGLENRIRQQRTRLLQPQTVSVPGESATLAESPPVQPAALSADERTRLDALELLSGDLADQRVQLAEQQERLTAAQAAFDRHRADLLAELEAFARRLQEREQTVLGAEQHLAEAEMHLRQRHDESASARRHLEGWQARLTSHESDWELERESLLGRCAASEQLFERERQALGELRRRWIAVRRRELERGRAEQTRCEQLRHESAGAREEWLQRCEALEQEQRRLAERGLALEQYRLETISQASDSVTAEKKLRKLQRHWEAVLGASALKLTLERRALQLAFSHLDDHRRQIDEQSKALAWREAESAERHAAWEHERASFESTNAQLRTEMQTSQKIGKLHEDQIETLRDEVERLARLLMDEPDEHSPPLDRAA
jgi:hypothetical protein